LASVRRANLANAICSPVIAASIVSLNVTLSAPLRPPLTLSLGNAHAPLGGAWPCAEPAVHATSGAQLSAFAIELDNVGARASAAP
jgi:hypothetical protein